MWTQIRLLPGEQSDQGLHCLPVCKNRLEKFARIFNWRQLHVPMRFLCCYSSGSCVGCSRVTFSFSLFLPQVFFFWCFGTAVLCDCRISCLTKYFCGYMITVKTYTSGWKYWSSKSLCYVSIYSTKHTINLPSAEHYENTPIQIYRKFHHQKNDNFQIKILIFFIFLLKT